ncbi:MAG: hypothetical protein AMS27_09210 [Bacteroides sp. SM23_62_1]|nr:MAG: hypothetical protein AMS27_09210 [Bacteroides sp. SM23_62_1]
MHVLIGYTVFPNSSIVEMTIKPMNSTPVVNSFLFWSNPSVHVDTNYQVIFPPSVQYVTQHAKREMTAWPVADRQYNRFDYTGINISLWKNIGVPSSFFSWDPKEDYFGGYDHGKQAGTVWVGNHHITPGMKFWAWGNNPGGDRANAGLTDTDGHYIELMAGAYTDNQPDYSWIQPYEDKTVKMIWFPIRELGGLKYASRDGALNVEVGEDNIAEIRINTTSPHQEAQILCKVRDKTLFREITDIHPGKPYSAEIVLNNGITEDDLEILLVSQNGEKLLSYSPAEHHPPDYPLPEALIPPAPPEEIATVEELYLTGLRLDQFYNASLDPMPYYEEALRRDPGDYRVNTQLGINYIKRMMWDEAEKKLRTAFERITQNYTRPKDGEALYYLGVTLRALGKQDEAYDIFYRASWSAAWHTPAYYQLAEIDCQRGEYEIALDHIERSISTNISNLNALNLKAVILRKTGHIEAAEQQVKMILKKDILNHQARNELALIKSVSNHTDDAEDVINELLIIMRDEVQSYLELAIAYASCGFYDEAVEVLSRLEKRGNNFPMLYYYLGYYWSKKGDEVKTSDYYKTASKQPHNYCFPFRSESVNILQHTMKVNPEDARAPYYLGNLLFEIQPGNAIHEWEKARDLDNTFYIVHRNLGLAYEKVLNDMKTALVSMEKAVECNSRDPRLLFEMDVLYNKNKASSETKYRLLKDNYETVEQRSECLLRLATRSVEVGEYDEAIDILINHSFPQFEGGQEFQEAFLNAYTLRGLDHFNAGSLEAARSDFETAMAYPVERFGRSRWAQLHYFMGMVLEATGEKVAAQSSCQNTLNVSVSRSSSDREYLYYHGLALQKTGKSHEAEELFQEMLNMARSESESGFFRQFEAGLSRDMQMASNHYLAGLAYEGLGEIKKAKQEFASAVELDPGHVWSKVHLELLEE